MLVLLVLVCLQPGQAGLLGAGQGDGSCAASPFRADTADLAWPEGCPVWAGDFSHTLHSHAQPVVMRVARQRKHVRACVR